ncbi:MAG: TolC family protein [Parvibaculum sp.]|jgi:outer membrane protein, heavy metal efflux system|uniref:TolC family protein n=1 Tax=Parvibaculum sp. TaxID=2024848 RepID=UPI0032EE7DFD
MKCFDRHWRRALLGICLSAGLVSPSFAAESVTLNEAIEKALSQNTNVRIADETIEERAAKTRQASLLPNPEVGVEVENVLGSGPYAGADEADVTVGLSQLIETGGKRRNRIEASRLAETVATAEREAVRRRLRERVAHAFNRLLAAQRDMELANAAAARIRDLVPALRERFERGASSEADLNRGLLTLDLAEIEAQAMQREQRFAEQALLALWSEAVYRPVRAKGALDIPDAALPAFSELLSRLDDHPTVRGARQVVGQRRAAFDLEKSNASPDVTLGAGARRFTGTDESAFLFSVSIPLTVFDRNQGNIDAAASQVVQADLDAQQVRVELVRELQEVYATYSSRCSVAARLSRSVIPASEKTAAEIEEGYLRGRFGVLDLLGAQETMIDARLQATEAILACRNAYASLDSLTGPFAEGELK